MARLAADLRLRGADAASVAVAIRLGLPLVTWNREQALRAAPRILPGKAAPDASPDSLTRFQIVLVGCD